MSEVPIRTLALNQRFTLHLDTTGRDIHGKLVRLTACSATVKLDAGGGIRTFTRLNRKTGEMETVTLPAPSTVEHWSTESLVRPGPTSQESPSQASDDSASEHLDRSADTPREGDEPARTLFE